ncbi:MAG: TonB-dependent receptor [Bacteroidaceae bacterium]|nr:TonB-dependent receptor [Bacteroidaceae bacterium]
MTAMVLLSTFAAISPLEDTLTQQLPVITITAPKELVPLDKVASAVSAISFETLQKSSTFRPNALSSIIPGLHIPDYGASLTSTIYLRGLGSRMENPVMGLYIDGIPVIDKNAYDFDWEGVSRATMLHGPQGTLYGRNAMGGVLSLSTFSPCDDYRPTLRIEYGTTNTVRAGISFTAGSNALSATFRHTDGYFYNAYKNEPCDPYDGLSLRWKRVSNCDGNLTMTNTLSANISQEGGFAYGMWKDGKQQPVSYNDEGSYKRLSVIEGFRLRHHGNLLVTDATASLQLLADDMHMDQDYTDRSIFTLQQKELSGAGTMEITIHRADEEAVWQPQTGLFSFGRRNQLSAPVTFKREGIETLILNNANSHIPTDIGQLAISDPEMPVNSDFMIDTWNAALFHESVFDFDRWLITAGIRFDYEGGAMDYDCITRMHYRFEPIMTADRDLSIPYKGTVSHSHFEVLPKLSALFRVSDDIKLFTTVSKGYRAGGFNTQIFSDILQNMTMTATMNDMGVYLDRPFVSVNAKNTEYDPETAWNMELGTRIRHESFSVEASAYYMDVRNQQLTVFPPGMSTGRMMTNAGRSRSMGVETQLGWTPGQFRSQLSWSWCDARFVSFNDGNEDYSGNHLPYVPEHTLFLNAGYSFKIGSKTLDVDASLRGEGPFCWNESGSQKEPFHLKANACIAFLSDNWEIFVRADNLTDETHRSFYFKSMGNEFFALDKPRIIMTGITLKL